MTVENEGTTWKSKIVRMASHRAFAPSLAVLVSLLCVRGVFTLSRIFYVRDLAIFNWPNHRWLHRTILAGQLPFWDPNPGAGYATVGDAALQILFLPLLPLRLLPELVGFNLAIALPFPIAALGMFLLARRFASQWASAVAAIAYAASGPVLSTGNLPNNAWSVAILPFIFLAVDRLAERPTARRFALLALLFCLQLTAGEPVSLVGTAVMATGFAAFGALPSGSSLRERARTTAVTIGAGLVGALLSAFQLFPLLDQARRSIRGFEHISDIWEIHPMRVAETVVPFVYGNYLGVQDEVGPWLFALNSQREPYVLSLYLGAFVVILAAAGIAGERQRKRAAYWCFAAIGLTICALGSMTPVYPVLQELVPLLSSFRYPSKYAVLAMLPVAALVAAGWDGITGASDRRIFALRAAGGAALVIVAGYALMLGSALASPQSYTLHALAGFVDDPSPSESTQWLVRSLLASAPRLAALLIAAGALVYYGRRSSTRALLVRTAAVVVMSMDLITANGGLNPTIDISLIDEPEWVALTRRSPDERVHTAVTFARVPGRVDVDAAPPAILPLDVARSVGLAERSSFLTQYPSGLDVRQPLSLDVTNMRPREYKELVGQYSRAERPVQYRFLRFVGTRYALVAQSPPPPATERMRFPKFDPVALYELGDVGSRVRVMTNSVVETETDRAIEALFNPLVLPASRVVVSGETVARGNPGPGAPATAQILSETTTSLTADASAPAEGGHLVLMDSFDPGWTATVDGEPAEIARAWGVYRAVRIAPGTHLVEFSYASQPFRLGLLVSLLTGLALLVVSVRRPGSRGAVAGEHTA